METNTTNTTNTTSFQSLIFFTPTCHAVLLTLYQSPGLISLSLTQVWHLVSHHIWLISIIIKPKGFTKRPLSNDLRLILPKTNFLSGTYFIYNFNDFKNYYFIDSRDVSNQYKPNI